MSIHLHAHDALGSSGFQRLQRYSMSLREVKAEPSRVHVIAIALRNKK